MGYLLSEICNHFKLVKMVEKYLLQIFLKKWNNNGGNEQEWRFTVVRRKILPEKSSESEKVGENGWKMEAYFGLE